MPYIFLIHTMFQGIFTTDTQIHRYTDKQIHTDQDIVRFLYSEPRFEKSEYVLKKQISRSPVAIELCIKQSGGWLYTFCRSTECQLVAVGIAGDEVSHPILVVLWLIIGWGT